MRLVQRERRRQRPDLLGRIRITEHHLQPATIGREPPFHGSQAEHLLHHSRRRRQVADRLKQGNDVQHRWHAPGGVFRQLVHRCDVTDTARKAHDVSPARVGPESLLNRRDGPQRIQHLCCLRRKFSFGLDRGKGLRVNLAVLAHLELRKMKAKRLRLPDEMLQLAVCLARRTRGGQGALDQAEVGDELCGARVCDARLDFPVRQSAIAGGPNAVGDVEEELSMLLGRRSFLELSPAPWVRRAQGGDALA